MPHKVLVNLATGLEDPERVPSRSSSPALRWGAGSKPRSGARRTRCASRCPVTPRAWPARAAAARAAVRAVRRWRGEVLVCPICATARQIDESDFVANARLAGAPPMLEWLGDEGTTVFSYSAFRWWRSGHDRPKRAIGASPQLALMPRLCRGRAATCGRRGAPDAHGSRTPHRAVDDDGCVLGRPILDVTEDQRFRYFSGGTFGQRSTCASNRSRSATIEPVGHVPSRPMVIAHRPQCRLRGPRASGQYGQTG